MQQGDKVDVLVAGVVAVAILASLVLFARYYALGGNLSGWILFLCGVLGAALGWTVGVLISPYGDGEKEAFASIGKLVYGFLTGYVVSKLDPLITALLRPEALTSGNTAAHLPLFGAAVGLAAFLASATVT